MIVSLGFPMVKAAVFDVDGVLVEAFVWARILEMEHGLDRSRTDPFFLGPFKKCILGESRLKEELLPFLEEWRWPTTVDEFVTRWFAADSAVNIQALEVVDDLRQYGLNCYIASTQEAERVAYLRNELGFGDRFDGFFFSCEMGVQKPDRRFFDLATQTIGVEPTQIVFFDDHQPNVDGAREAGWRAELCRIGDDLRGMLRKHGVRMPHA